MTDKQIIIDGVDIKDCKRRVGKDNFCRYYKRPCAENNFNCIWKKYLRKEQECEELKGRLKYIINENKVLKDCATDEHIDIVALKNYISTLEFHNDQLKAEKEELKNAYARLNSLYNDNCNFTGKLEQTLTEIKDMCSEMNCESLMQNSWCGNTDFKMGCCEKLFKKQILQKISECEV